LEFVVYSYNIHSGKNVVFKPTLSRMINYFLENKADLIGLQEVQNNSKFGRQFLQFKKSLQLNGLFGSNLAIADGGYGNAWLSRFPLELQENYRLPGLSEPRGVLYSTIHISGQKLHCYNTHLGLSKKERNAQMDILRKLVERSKDPAILLGDFNTTHSPFFSTLGDLAIQTGNTKQSTVFPLRRRIDYIFASHHMKLLEYEVIKLPFSDHFPIRAVLKLK
jgi:endonuclease/exonuclease/phosphatase family metal-dependent hydrolase